MIKDLSINGRAEQEHAETIAELLKSRGTDAAQGFIAVAVNGVVVRRGEWERWRLNSGDAVEIVAPRQGG